MEHIQRTSEHSRESIAIESIRLSIAKWRWTTNVIKIEQDYGEDLMLRIRAFEDTRPLGRFFQIQVKSIESVEKRLLSDGMTISYPIDTKHLSSWLYIPEPVLLVLFDSKTEKAFWTYIQEYILEKLFHENPSWQNQETVNVPVYQDKTFSSELSTPKELISLKLYSIDALLRTGVICIQDGDNIQALKCFEHANRLSPDFATRFFIFNQLTKLKINNKITNTDLSNDLDLENYISIISLLDDYADLLIAYKNNSYKDNFIDKDFYLCPLTLTTFILYFTSIRLIRKYDPRLIRFDTVIVNSISSFLKKEPECFLIGNAHIIFLFNVGLYLLDSDQKQLALQCFSRMFLRIPELGEEMAKEEIKRIFDEVNDETDETSKERIRQTILEAQENKDNSKP